MNPNVIVIAGTSDGRELAEMLCQLPCRVIVCVATALGTQYMKKNEKIDLREGKLDEKGFIQLLEMEKPLCLLDCSHPYAAQVSAESMQACRKTGTPYLRYERPIVKYENDFVFYIPDYQEAIQLLNGQKENFLVTTGTNHLKEFQKVTDWKSRMYARVLGHTSSVEYCLKLGMKQDHIIAENGPFTTERNLEHIERFHIQAMVAKDSGEAGGLPAKVEAVQKARIPLWIITRPVLQYENQTNRLNDAVQWVRHMI